MSPITASGASQVQLAVEKRPAGKLPRPGWPGARGKQSPQNAGEQIGPPMAGDLHHILTGIAVGRSENQGHAFVNIPFFVRHVAVGRCISGKAVKRTRRACRTENTGGDGNGIPARNPHYAEPAGAAGVDRAATVGPVKDSAGICLSPFSAAGIEKQRAAA